MPDLRLLRITREMEVALAAGPAAFEKAAAAGLGQSAELTSQVLAQTLAMPGAESPAGPCGGYLAIDRASNLIIGTCGFKGAPAPDGTVEIAYFTFPGFEGRGYATAMARSLLRTALDSPNRGAVIAHTLPENSASTSILRKIGMEFRGPVDDPEDGLVWRWQYPVPAPTEKP